MHSLTFLRLALLLLVGLLAAWSRPSLASAAAPVAITEVLWAGSDLNTADEWLELAWTGSGDALPAEGLTLSGWTIASVSSGGEQVMLRFGAEDVLTFDLYVVSNYASSVSRLADEPAKVDTSVSLSNSALHLRLRDASGALVDEVGDGGAPFAGRNAAPKASMERIDPLADGRDPSNWRTAELSAGYDEGVTLYGTPGYVHWEIPEEEEPPVEEEPPAEESPEEELPAEELPPEDPPTGSGGTVEEPTAGTGSGVSSSVPAPPPIVVRVSEVLADPTGADDGEWIEIENAGAVLADLAGLVLERVGGGAYIFPSGSGSLLDVGEFRVMERRTTGITLPNTGGVVRLRDGSEVLDEFPYGGVPESVSVARDWTDPASLRPACVPTPATANRPPELRSAIVIQSGVPSGRERVSLNLEAVTEAVPTALLECRWDFGDGGTAESCNPPSRTFNATSTVSLTVSTVCGDTALHSLGVEVLPAEQSVAPSTSVRSSASSSSAAACAPAAVPVRVESFVPDPVGDDGAETITLGNPSGVEIDLCGWRLDDEEGGSSPFALDGQRIAANGVLTLPRATTGIALNNDGDLVRLLPPAGIGIGEAVAYEDASEGATFIRGADGSFGWETADAPSAEQELSISLAASTLEARVLRVLLGGEVIVRLAGAGRVTILLPVEADGETLRSLLHGASLELGYASSEDPPERPSTVRVGGVPLEDLLADGPSEDAGEGFSLDGDVRIVEVYASPDPDAEGPLADEWIELHNAGESDVHLDGWQLDDDPATGDPWAIPDGTLLPAGARIVLAASGIRLNNDGDAVLLLDPSGAVRDEAEVPALKAAMSYARLESGEWCVTTLPTPGEENACVRAAVSSRKASSSKAARKVAVKPKIVAKAAVSSTASASDSSSGYAALRAQLLDAETAPEPEGRWGEYLVWAVAVSLSVLSIFLLLVGRRTTP